jgi:glyoxylate/hydroxypyruvate reductase
MARKGVNPRARRAGRRAGRGGRTARRGGWTGPVRIHLINSPDIESNWFDPARLAPQAAARLRGRRPVAVTVSDDPTAIPPAMRAAHALVGFRLPTAEIRALPSLRWIHLVSAGVDHLLPLGWLPSGVQLTNSSGVHSELAGEYACGALLMLNARVPAHATNQRRGHWDQVFNSPIRGKTVLVVGLGAIGGEVARRAKGLGLEVVGVRRTGRVHPAVAEVHRPSDLAALLPRAAFVVVTAPLTSETRHLIGPKELDLLPAGAGLVNMSRAGLMDEAALAERLEAGRLGGAIVDVCDPEPLPASSPLWHVKNLLITPHISSDPTDYVERMTVIFLDNLARLVAGQPLRNRVQPEREY